MPEVTREANTFPKITDKMLFHVFFFFFYDAEFNHVPEVRSLRVTLLCNEIKEKRNLK